MLRLLAHISDGILTFDHGDGLDVETLEARMEIDEIEKLEDPFERDRVATRRFFAVFAEYFPKEPPGLSAARHVRTRGFGILGQLMLNSATYREALGRFVRYQELHHQPDEIAFDEREDVDVVHWPSLTRHHTPPTYEPAAIFAIAVSLNDIRQQLDDPNIAPREVHLMTCGDQFLRDYEEYFGVAVTIGGDTTRVLYEPELFDRPLDPPDPVIGDYLEELAGKRLEESRQRHTIESAFTGRLREALATRLGDAKITQGAVARQLGMSVRTLQRRLNEDDLSFREVLDEVRRDHALHLLGRAELSFSEIAFRLGYAQASSFNRACKRWTGKTPSELREASVSQPAES